MQSIRRHRILLIYREKKIDHDLIGILKLNGFQFDHVVTDIEAIEAMQKKKYGLILQDLDNDEEAPFRFVRELKRSSNTKNTPLIFLTEQLCKPDFIKQGHENVAVDYILKPFDKDIFLLKVYNFMKLYIANIELEKANKLLERKHVRAQISFQDLYNSLEQEIFLLDRKGIVTNINRTKELICGLEADDIQGKPYSRSRILKKIFENVTDFERSNFKTELPTHGIKKQFEFKRTDGLVITIESTINKTLVDGAYYIQVVINDLSHKKKVENQIVMNFREISNSDKINQSVIRGASLDEISSLLIQNLGEIADTKGSRVYMINERENKLTLSGEKLDSNLLSKIEDKIGIKASRVLPSISEGSFFRNIIDEKKVIITSDRKEIRKIISSHTENALLRKFSVWAQNLMNINTMGILPLYSNKTVFGIITFMSDKELDHSEKIAIARYVKQASMVLWRKKIELDLAENEERFELAMKGANDGLWDWNLLTNKVYYSPLWKSMLGYHKNELENDISTWQELIHPEDKEKTWLHLDDYLNDKVSEYVTEFRMKHKGGNYIDILARGIGVKDQSGKFIRMVGTHVDLTDRKKEEEEKALLSSIIESTSDLVGIASADHKIIYMNEAGKKMLGYQTNDILLKHISQIIPERIYNNFIKKILNIAMKRGRVEGETNLITKKIERVPVSFVILAHKDKLGEVKYYSTIARDISKIRNAESKIRESEAFNRGVLSSIGSQIAVINTKGEIISVNDAWISISAKNEGNDLTQTGVGSNYFEVCERAIIAKNPYARKALQGIKSVVSKEVSRFEMEYPYDSVEKKRWYILSVTGFKDDYKKVVIRHIDITIRKENEEMLTRSQLEIRNFAGYLNKVLEDERSHIAREMHDEVGQQLSGIKMGLSLLVKEGALNDKLSLAATETTTLVDNAIKSMRNIATELRPGILDTLGLIPSLKWLCSEFEKKSGITCLFKSHADKDIFEKDLSTCYFRICQESLNNIFKHAGATKVNVTIEQSYEMLSLKIVDNGSGMSENSLRNPFSMGLLGMKERAYSIGGEVFVKSKLGAGTTIEIITTLI
jgi:PAS domain S-box-containing protein